MTVIPGVVVMWLFGVVTQFLLMLVLISLLANMVAAVDVVLLMISLEADGSLLVAPRVTLMVAEAGVVVVALAMIFVVVHTCRAGSVLPLW